MILRYGFTSKIISALLIVFSTSIGLPVSSDVLPSCPAPQTIEEFVGLPIPYSTVFLDRGNAGAFSKTVTKGLARTPPCANMNYVRPLKVITDPIPTSADRAIQSFASPSTAYLSDAFTDITFEIIGAGVPAPFVASFPSCMPVSSNGTCNISGTSPQVAVRVADSEGNFSGPWSVIQPWKDSPVQFDRLGDCTSTAPVPSTQEPSPGPPCTYRLTFLRNPNAANDFVLKKRTQVLVATVWQGGITLSEDGAGTNYEGTDHTVFSLVLEAGSPPSSTNTNAELRSLIDQITQLVKLIKQRVPKAKRAEQDGITASLRDTTAELQALIGEKLASILLSSESVNMPHLGRKVDRSIKRLIKRKAKTFSEDKRGAHRVLKAILKGLAAS